MPRIRLNMPSQTSISEEETIRSNYPRTILIQNGKIIARSGVKSSIPRKFILLYGLGRKQQTITIRRTTVLKRILPLLDIRYTKCSQTLPTRIYLSENQPWEETCFLIRKLGNPEPHEFPLDEHTNTSNCAWVLNTCLLATQIGCVPVMNDCMYHIFFFWMSSDFFWEFDLTTLLQWTELAYITTEPKSPIREFLFWFFFARFCQLHLEEDPMAHQFREEFLCAIQGVQTVGNTLSEFDPVNKYRGGVLPLELYDDFETHFELFESKYRPNYLRESLDLRNFLVDEDQEPPVSMTEEEMDSILSEKQVRQSTRVARQSPRGDRQPA